MKLSALCRLDGIKLSDELAEKRKFIAECRYLLSEPTALDEKLISILNEVAEKFGDARRTQITDILGETEEPEVIEEEEVIISLINSTIKASKKEEVKKHTKKEIFTTNLNSLLCITSSGKIYATPISKLKYNKEYRANEVFDIGSEKVLLITDTLAFTSYLSLTCVTKNNYIKKSSTSDCLSKTKKGTPVIKLEDGDNLIAAILSSNDDDAIVIIGSNNYYNCYPLSEIGYTGKMTKGVKAIKLSEGEYVKDAHLVGDEEYKLTNRAVKGVKLNG